MALPGSPKQDRNGVRSAPDLERKYDFSSLVGTKKAVRLTEEGLTKTNKILEEFIEATVGDIANLQKQVDGKVETWFYEGVPMLDNEPAKNWSQDDYPAHQGDLYYDQLTGYAYRFSLVDGAYIWLRLSDTDVIEALALANAASDTADGKRRVFTSLPVPPYDNGDLWFHDKEIYICQISKGDGEIYAEKDFIIATKYTDDTKATQVGDELTIVKGTVTTIQEGMDTYKVEITTRVNGLGTEVEVAKTSILANTEQIDLRVRKDGIIGAINLTNETAKIQAGKIELEGAVTITALDSSLRTTIEGHSTQLNVLDGEIDLRVKKDGIIGAINLTNETAKIQAGKIELEGAVTITALDENLKNTLDDHGTRLNVLNGQISTKIWQNDINSAVSSVESSVSTQYSQISQEIDKIKTTVSSNTENISKKADGSTVTTLDNKVTTLEQNLDGFKTTVSQTYTTQKEFNALEIGGRNRLVNSEKWNDFTCPINSIYYNTKNILVTPGEVITISYDVKATEDFTGNTLVVQYYNDLGERLSYEWSIATITTEYTRHYITVTIPDNISYIRLGLRSGSSIQKTYRRIKVESGNKATDWTPAPEDTDSEITTLAEKYTSIEQTVSSISATVESHTETISQKASTSVVTDISQTLTTVKAELEGFEATVSETYATKTSVEEVEGQFVNYSTTKEMLSQISQSKESIINTVSATYTTLEEFNALEVGATNLLRYMNEYTVDNPYTLTATKDNYFKLTPGRVQLKAGVTYTFGCQTDGEWLAGSSGDSVEAFLLLDGKYTTYFGLPTNPYTFTPSTSGLYTLRLDVNSSGVTHSFWNIQIEKGNKATDWRQNLVDTNAEITTVKTIATQNADKFNWLVSGESETSFTLTDRMAKLTTQLISLNAEEVQISGDMIVDGAITATKITIDDLHSLGAKIGGWDIEETYIKNDALDSEGYVRRAYIQSMSAHEAEDTWVFSIQKSEEIGDYDGAFTYVWRVYGNGDMDTKGDIYVGGDVYAVESIRTDDVLKVYGGVNDGEYSFIQGKLSVGTISYNNDYNLMVIGATKLAGDVQIAGDILSSLYVVGEVYAESGLRTLGEIYTSEVLKVSGGIEDGIYSYIAGKLSVGSTRYSNEHKLLVDGDTWLYGDVLISGDILSGINVHGDVITAEGASLNALYNRCKFYSTSGAVDNYGFSLESGMYLLSIIDSLSTTSRGNPSLAIVYVDSNKKGWSSLWLGEDSKIYKVIYGDSGLSILLSETRYLSVCVYNIMK